MTPAFVQHLRRTQGCDYIKSCCVGVAVREEGYTRRPCKSVTATNHAGRHSSPDEAALHRTWLRDSAHGDEDGGRFVEPGLPVSGSLGYPGRTFE